MRKLEAIEAMYPQQVETLGSVRRIYYVALYRFGIYDDASGDRQSTEYEWHYFGTTPAQFAVPNHADATVFQNDYISLPQDLDLMPASEVNQYFYQMAMIAGRVKEGYPGGLE